MKKIVEITEKDIGNFKAHFCPFGNYDIEAALEVVGRIGIDADEFAERVFNKLDRLEVWEFEKTDIVCVAYQEFLKELDEDLSMDLGFDTEKIDVYEILPIFANYSDTTFNAPKGALAEALGLDKDIYSDNLDLAVKIIKREIHLEANDDNNPLKKFGVRPFRENLSFKDFERGEAFKVVSRHILVRISESDYEYIIKNTKGDFLEMGNEIVTFAYIDNKPSLVGLTKDFQQEII